MGNKLAYKNQKKSSIVKHNVYGMLNIGSHRCDVCQIRKQCEDYEAGADCKILSEYADRMSEIIYSMPFITEVDAALVNELIQVNCTLQLIRMYYAAVGEIRIDADGGAPVIKGHPIAAKENHLRNQVIRISDALGLTPDARRRMKVSAVQIMDIASRAREIDHDNR